jgi:hypothetical protein
MWDLMNNSVLITNDTWPASSISTIPEARDIDEISCSVEGGFTIYITEVLKFRDVRHTRHTAHIGELRNAHNILEGVRRVIRGLSNRNPFGVCGM